MKALFLSGTFILLAGAAVQSAPEAGFTSLFDGKSLDGWKLMDKKGEGYGVKDGMIYCAKGGGGRLLTEKEFSDFIVRFEFKLEEGSNNGLGIRAPYEGDAAYVGMEIQILDDSAPQSWRQIRASNSVPRMPSVAVLV